MTGGSRSEHLAAIRPDADLSEADWWETDSPDGDATPAAVGFLVPAGFEAYARVLHPAADRRGALVRWSQVAAEVGTTLHPQAQWWRLAGHRDLDPRGEGPEPVRWQGREPGVGRLDRSALEALADVLSRHTATPERTFVAFWVGYGFWPPSWDGLHTTQRPGRESWLFERPLGAVVRLCAEASGNDWWQSPSAWWPADHAWATSNDTDLDSTLVGGSRALVDDLLADDRLEVLPWPVDGSLWAGADDVNR